MPVLIFRSSRRGLTIRQGNPISLSLILSLKLLYSQLQVAPVTRLSNRPQRRSNRKCLLNNLRPPRNLVAGEGREHRLVNSQAVVTAATST